MHHHAPAGGGPGSTAVLVVAAAVAVAVAVGYLAAAQRLRRRGDAWPPYRTVSWLAGVACVPVAVVAPLPGADFTAHMVGHLLLGMVGPLLLVCARPVTLTLRALRPGPVRAAMTSASRSRLVAAITAPPVAAALDMGGLWLLYRTPLFSAMAERPWLAVPVHVHVFAAGLLFSFAVCGLDPVRHRYGVGFRAGVLLLAGAAHGILAKGLYAYPPPGTTFAPRDLQVGAQVMYYGGDVVGIALAVVLAVQWYTRTGRARARAARGNVRSTAGDHDPPLLPSGDAGSHLSARSCPAVRRAGTRRSQPVAPADSAGGDRQMR